MEEKELNDNTELEENGEPLRYTSTVTIEYTHERKKYSSENYENNSKDGLNDALNDMGFTSNGASRSNTLIIYPRDLEPGETLPVVVMVGGDNQNSRFRNGYFRTYETVNGEPLPRAIYVVSGPSENETLEDNAILDAYKFLESHGVDASQVGVEAFSGGGGAGLMIAEQAAQDNPNIPVVVLLNDASKWGQEASQSRQDYINGLNLYSTANRCDNLSIVYFESNDDRVTSMWKKISEKVAQRAYHVTWNLNSYGFCSHAGANYYSQYYNFLLSLMGLTDNLTDEKNGYRVKNGADNKKDLVESIGSMVLVAYSGDSLQEYLNGFMTQINSFGSEDAGSASGNDLIELENSMANSVSSCISDISSVLSMDASLLAGIGESMEGLDERLKRMQDENILDLFKDFSIPEHLNKPNEDIIIVDDNDRHIDLDDLENEDDIPIQDKPDRNNSHSYTPQNSFDTSPIIDLKKGVYLLGVNNDGAKVIIDYDGKKVTNMVYQYDFNDATEAQTIKNMYSNSKLVSDVKIFNNDKIVEVTLKKSVYSNKSIDELSKGLNMYS